MEKVGRCWRVFNEETGKEHAKCTTKKNAEAQLRLLRGVEKGTFKPTGGVAPLETPQPKTTPSRGVKRGATPPLTWRQYFTENTKGKKFSKENTLGEHMKKLAAEWRKMKSA